MQNKSKSTWKLFNRFVTVSLLLSSASVQAMTSTGNDGAPMNRIPQGTSWMGSLEGEGSAYEKPRHQVTLDAFYLDQYEVTVERYQEFLRATNLEIPEYWDQVNPARDRNKPVVGISWHDAEAYCEWAGKRLPTEAEWEKAARGTDERQYPWGNVPPSSNVANYNQSWTPETVYRERLKPAGSYEEGKGPYGSYDMAGNVWEWVADWSDESDDHHRSPQNPILNPKGPSTGKYKVLRGGSWNSRPTYLRSAHRVFSSPPNRTADEGVRCAKDAP